MAQPTPIGVVLDVGPAVHQTAGLARYAERLASHLLAGHGEEIDLTLFFNRHSGHGLPVSLQNTQTVTVERGQYAWRLGALASQLLRSTRFERSLPPGALYHATEHLLPRLARLTVLTVHDLIFAAYPQHHTYTNRAFLQVAMPLFVRAADAIIAVSQQTRRDLVDRYATPPAKIQVIYEGIDDRFAPIGSDWQSDLRGQYSPDRPYLLMVGTLEPRKNHATAMRALARLKQAGHPQRLLISGGQGWLFEPVRRLVEELGLTGDVTFAGRVPDDDLPALYAGADALLLPSLYEGFGFPVLEAMACGTPVVCSNSSSLPEVAGDAALLVPPTDDEALAAAVERILTEPGLAADLRRRGAIQAARFRWERCAAETVAVYEELIRPRSSGRRFA
ncbi:MAG: glycosyltransferase family 4 protein [Chloroflexi bacterium]|nr:glycosyltransferase family 4 protein [Chloroflexota bacterium]